MAEPWRVELRLASPTPTLNEALRLHWSKLKRYERGIAWEVRCAIGRRMPPRPLQHARVTIERRSLGTPDQDNLVGGTKWLVDALLVPQQRGKQMLHRCGLGLIVDDDPAHLDRRFRPVRVAHAAEQCTILTIEEIPGSPGDGAA